MDAQSEATIGRVVGEIAVRVHRRNPWCEVEDLIGEGWKHVLGVYEDGYDPGRPLAPWVSAVAHHHLHWYARRWAPDRIYERARTGSPKVIAWSSSYEELDAVMPELTNTQVNHGHAVGRGGAQLLAAALRDQPRWPDALIDDRAWWEAAYEALFALTGGDVAELDRLLDGRDAKAREELRDLGTRARRLLNYVETTNPHRLRQQMTEAVDDE